MQVVPTEKGMEICKGHIYVGAGDEHFTIERNGQRFICRVGGKAKVERSRYRGGRIRFNLNNVA